LWKRVEKEKNQMKKGFRLPIALSFLLKELSNFFVGDTFGGESKNLLPGHFGDGFNGL
jgi:hypothetical protein